MAMELTLDRLIDFDRANRGFRYEGNQAWLNGLARHLEKVSLDIEKKKPETAQKLRRYSWAISALMQQDPDKFYEVTPEDLADEEKREKLDLDDIRFNENIASVNELCDFLQDRENYKLVMEAAERDEGKESTRTSFYKSLNSLINNLELDVPLADLERDRLGLMPLDCADAMKYLWNKATDPKVTDSKRLQFLSELVSVYGQNAQSDFEHPRIDTRLHKTASNEIRRSVVLWEMTQPDKGKTLLKELNKASRGDPDQGVSMLFDRYREKNTSLENIRSLSEKDTPATVFLPSQKPTRNMSLADLELWHNVKSAGNRIDGTSWEEEEEQEAAIAEELTDPNLFPERARRVAKALRGTGTRAFGDSKEYTDVLKSMEQVEKSPTIASRYVAAERVKKYLSDKMDPRKSPLGKARFNACMAFLKYNMPEETFAAFCQDFNRHRNAAKNDKDFIDYELFGTAQQVRQVLEKRVEEKRATMKDRLRLSLLKEIKGDAQFDLIDPVVLDEKAEKLEKQQTVGSPKLSPDGLGI